MPLHEEYNEALEGNTDIKKIIEFSELNEHAYDDLILTINMNSLVCRVAFSLLCNSKNPELLREIWKIAWGRLINKYALFTASSLLKLESKFNNSKLGSAEKGQDE